MPLRKNGELTLANVWWLLRTICGLNERVFEQFLPMLDLAFYPSVRISDIHNKLGTVEYAFQD